MTTAIYPSLAGKRVVVAGGSSGIGAGIVKAFAKQGAAVIFIDIAVDEFRALERSLSASPVPPVMRLCDLTDIDAVQSTLASIGTVDVLVNNAANHDRHTSSGITPQYWDERIAANLRHLLFCAKAFVPGMKENGGGAIINIGSISWHIGLPDLVMYETAKAGIEGMTRALARDLGPDNIRVTCVMPGSVRTPRQMRRHTPEGEAAIVAQQCLKARLEPEHVAALVLFLAADDGRLCTGHGYWIDSFRV